VLRIRVWDPGWVKNQDPDPGSGSGMNIPDNISESLETIFLVNLIVLQFFNSDPGSGIFLSQDPGSGMEKIKIRDLG
jgi:hypothetical protein